jgi:hypothetical protein
MGDDLRRRRSGTKRANFSFRRHLSRVVATRIAGAAVGIAGISLMGVGTVASPTVLQFASVDSTVSIGNLPLLSSSQTIVSISENCSSGVTTGTLTVNNPVAGDTVTLGVYAHQDPNGDGLWHYTGSSTTITMVSGQTTYPFTISSVPAAYSDGPVSGEPGNDSKDADKNGDDYNSWRVQVKTASGTFAGRTTKSGSYDCSAAGTTTTSSTTASSSTSTTSSHTTTSTTTTTPGTTSTSGGTPGSSTTATAPGTATTSKATTSTAAGVLGASTSTPSTGAGIAFGAGLGLLILGGGLLFGARPLLRRRKK